MKILRINHVGLVSKSPTECQNFFQNILGLTHQGSEKVEEQKVFVEMLNIENSRLEILKPTSNESPISKFLEKKGSGIHHIALEVDNLSEWLSYLKSKNVSLVDETPRAGAHHTKIAFIHPNSTGGVLIELVEKT